MLLRLVCFFPQADGLPQHRHQSILLDLSNRAYVFQYLHVNVTETPIIPYDIDRYYVYGSNKAFVSIVGDVVGPIFPTMPVNATTLLDLPMVSKIPTKEGIRSKLTIKINHFFSQIIQVLTFTPQKKKLLKSYTRNIIILNLINLPSKNVILP